MRTHHAMLIMAMVVVSLSLIAGIAVCATISFYNYVEARHEQERKELAEETLGVMQAGMKDGFKSVSEKIPTLPFQKVFDKRQDKHEQDSHIFARGILLGK